MSHQSAQDSTCVKLGASKPYEVGTWYSRTSEKRTSSLKRTHSVLRIENWNYHSCNT